MVMFRTMKWLAVLTVGVLAAQAGAQGTAAPKPQPESAAFKTQAEKAAYAIGVNIAKNLKQEGIEVNMDAFMKGIKDGLTDAKLLLTDDEMRATLMAFQNEVMQKRTQTEKVAGDKNKQEGEAFLAKNKAEKGVVTLPSGLQYKILKEGTGKKPTADNTVECNYKGTLINGTEFDSSARHGGPASFKVSGVIRGWTEALQLMPVGSKWQLFIPSQLAYGEQGAGRDIGPNATLIFEVELVAIK